MANIKIIDLPTGSPESDSFLEATQVNAQAESGRSSAKIAFNAFGNWMAGQGQSPLQYNGLNTDSDTLIGAINELHDSIGADVYNTNTSYTAGMYCIYNNTLYRCVSPTSGAWDSSKWEAKTIVDAISELNTVVPISAVDFFTSDTISGVDTNEFYAYRIGKMVCVERCKLVNVSLVSPTYKIVGVKDEYLPNSNIRICGQFDGSGQLDIPYRMYLSPSYKGFGSEKWGSYSAIWIYSFTYFID